MKSFKDIISHWEDSNNVKGHHKVLPENINNPWPGLSPYKDPVGSAVKRKFCGREKEIFELTRMIDDNIFVTLYGKSGNGKTSLLNAGVFPQLRKMQYAPISIRLGMDSIGMSFQQCIIHKIENYFTKECIDERWVIPPTNDKTSADFLWNYFARHRFYSDKNHKTIVYPVITLDQFEEVYRNRREEADILLRQINYLIDESHELEDCVLENGELYTYEYNYRFLVSIREDDLFWLEDSIDNYMLYPMKETRYRLRPLSNKGAHDVIFIPGEGLFNEADKNKISKTIIEIARGYTGEISSNVLSLICNRIYVEHLRTGGNGYISYDLVNNFVSANPLEKFYLEATSHLTNSERAYLEDNLVDIEGRRGYVPLANFEKVFKNKGTALLKGPQKILQENNEKIELIHDSFCQVLTEQKTKRLDRWRTIVEHVALMVMCILLCYKQILYHPFCTSIEPTSFAGEMLCHAMGTFELFSVIFMFIAIGIIRKSFPTKLTWIAVIILILPIVSDQYMNSSSAHLPVVHHILSFLLLSFIIAAHIYNYRNRSQDVKKRNNLNNLLNIRSLRFWLFVYLCFIVYYYIYKAPNGWYVGKIAFTAYLIFIPSTFYSVFQANEEGAGWALVMFFLWPIAFIIYYTSDTNLFTFSAEFSTSFLLSVMLMIGFPLYQFWDYLSVVVDKPTNRVLIYILFIVITIGMYALLYQNKILMLTIWCAFFYFFQYLLFKEDNKYESILCIATFLLTIGVYLFTKSYNPLIKNVDIAEQKGEWHWNTVMAKSGDDYRVYDGITGRDILGIGFDYQDEDLNLVKAIKSNTNIGYQITNALYSVTDSTIIYKSHPTFEKYIIRESERKDLATTILQHHRKWIFNDFIEPKHHRTGDQLQNYIGQLTMQEMEELNNTLTTGNDSIVKHNVSQLLCKTLSSSWLCHATDSMGKIGDMLYFNYLCAFNLFIESHFYEQMYEEKNADWDGTFERISEKYIGCMDSIRMPPHDKFLETEIPMLIKLYNEANDYGLKTMLYGKIIRMQQLSILYGLGREKWSHSNLKSPVGVDINEFYKEHRR